MALKKGDMAASTTSNIVIKDDDGNNIGTFYCPNDVMQSFFSKLSEMQLFRIEKSTFGWIICRNDGRNDAKFEKSEIRSCYKR